MAVDVDVVGAAEALRARLVPADLDATLHAITTAAVELVPGVHEASVSMRRSDGTLQSYAMTGEVISLLDECQAELREGPCYDSTSTGSVVVAEDLRQDPRYPRFGPFAAGHGIRSLAGVRLFENARAVGALNLYSREVGAVGDADVLTRLFASQAGIALTYSVEIQGLHEAMQSRARIGQAVGIVMERYQLSDQQAFAFLTRLSQQGNTKLRRIAEELIRGVSGS
jgi:GAF domain-containing protein